MNYLNEKIIPYKGLESFRLGDNLECVRSELKSNNVPFNQMIDSNKDCTPPIPWTNISINKSIMLTFAKDILFRIYVENDYSGTLPNGVQIGMDLKELKLIDDSIQYDEDEEYYYSQHGYWVNEDINTNRVEGIVIFIPEIENDDQFWNYEWTNKYEQKNA